MSSLEFGFVDCSSSRSSLSGEDFDAVDLHENNGFPKIAYDASEMVELDLSDASATTYKARRRTNSVWQRIRHFFRVSFGGEKLADAQLCGYLQDLSSDRFSLVEQCCAGARRRSPRGRIYSPTRFYTWKQLESQANSVKDMHFASTEPQNGTVVMPVVVGRGRHKHVTLLIMTADSIEFYDSFHKRASEYRVSSDDRRKTIADLAAVYHRAIFNKRQTTRSDREFESRIRFVDPTHDVPTIEQERLGIFERKHQRDNFNCGYYVAKYATKRFGGEKEMSARDAFRGMRDHSIRRFKERTMGVHF